MEKVCRNCKSIKPTKEFNHNKATKDGYNIKCRDCTKEYSTNYYKNYTPTQKQQYISKTKLRLEDDNKKARLLAQMAFHRAKTVNRVPKWYRIEDCIPFYLKSIQLTKETGVLHEVDHIIPLKHNDISGLHVSDNLAIITDAENIVKMDSWDGTIDNKGWTQKINKLLDILNIKYPKK